MFCFSLFCVVTLYFFTLVSSLNVPHSRKSDSRIEPSQSYIILFSYAGELPEDFYRNIIFSLTRHLSLFRFVREKSAENSLVRYSPLVFGYRCHFVCIYYDFAYKSRKIEQYVTASTCPLILSTLDLQFRDYYYTRSRLQSSVGFIWFLHAIWKTRRVCVLNM